MDKKHPKAKSANPRTAKARKPKSQPPHPVRDQDDLDARLDDALEDTFPASDPIELSNVQD